LTRERPPVSVQTPRAWASQPARAWYSVDGTRDSLFRSTGDPMGTTIPVMSQPGCRNGQLVGPRPLPCTPLPAYRTDLPTDVDGMQRRLEAGPSLVAVLYDLLPTTFISRLPSPQSQALVFEAPPACPASRSPSTRPTRARSFVVLAARLVQAEDKLAFAADAQAQQVQTSDIGGGHTRWTISAGGFYKQVSAKRAPRQWTHDPGGRRAAPAPASSRSR
jgi:hypothetical protein